MIRQQQFALKPKVFNPFIYSPDMLATYFQQELQHPGRHLHLLQPFGRSLNRWLWLNLVTSCFGLLPGLDFGWDLAFDLGWDFALDFGFVLGRP